MTIITTIFPILSTPGNDEQDNTDETQAGTPIFADRTPITVPTDYPQPTNVVADSNWNVTFTGLDYLENLAIDIIIDGAVYVPQIVTGGEVTVALPEVADEDRDPDITHYRAVLGLSYISEVRPYVMDIKGQDGTSLGRTQRITKLDIDFYRSLGAFVGKIDPETGTVIEEEIPFRVPNDDMGVGVPLYTGIYHWDFVEGFSRKTDYFIKQKQPLPLTVRGITDTSEVYE